VVGFTNAVAGTCGNVYGNYIFGDDTNGFLNPGGGDIAVVQNSEFFPWLVQGSSYSSISWPVTAMANNGSGAIRLTVSKVTVGTITNVGFLDAPSGFSASANVPANYAALYGAGGITSANGNVQLTIVDDTHADVVGSTYSGSYTSGGTLAISAQLRTGTAFKDSGSTGTNFVGDFSFGYHTHMLFSTGSFNPIVTADRCDGPGLDATSICYDVEANAQNVYIQSNFASGHMTGTKVNTSWTGGANTLIAPKTASVVTAGFTNSNYYGLDMEAGSLDVIGGGIYNTIYIADGAGLLYLSGVYNANTFSYQSAGDAAKVTNVGPNVSGAWGASTLNGALTVGAASAADFVFTGGASIATLGITGTIAGTALRISDGNGTLLQVTQSASVAQANYFSIQAAPTLASPAMSSVGANTNIGMVFATKGNGTVFLQGDLGISGNYMPTAVPCGGTGTVNGYNSAFTVTQGATASASCTIIPGAVFSSNPVCTVTPGQLTGGAPAIVATTGTIVITEPTATTGGVFSVHCIVNS
jgi:hypothetical protein